MIVLRAQQQQWATGASDDPWDQCSHGAVQFQIHETCFVKPEDGIWTTSAAALYLLRSLTHNHTADDSLTGGSQMFPCCGFCVWETNAKFRVHCVGCSTGMDFEILHADGSVAIQSGTQREVVPQILWTEAVLAFVDEVKGFYDRSSGKLSLDEELEEDRLGWQAFWSEWDERYAAAKGSLAQSR